MKAYENLIHITPDMVVLESIGTTISPMTGLSYAVMQDGKHYDPDTETYIGEIDVDEYMGTISNDDEITFMAIQDQELNDYERYYKFAKGGKLTKNTKSKIRHAVDDILDDDITNLDLGARGLSEKLVEKGVIDKSEIGRTTYFIQKEMVSLGYYEEDEYAKGGKIDFSDKNNYRNTSGKPNWDKISEKDLKKNYKKMDNDFRDRISYKEFKEIFIEQDVEVYAKGGDIRRSPIRKLAFEMYNKEYNQLSSKEQKKVEDKRDELMDKDYNSYKKKYFAKGGMITEESNYDIIANVKKEQGESDFYYALYDKLVAYGERPKIAFSEMKEVFDNYDENMSDYIDLPFAKGGEVITDSFGDKYELREDEEININDYVYFGDTGDISLVEDEEDLEFARAGKTKAVPFAKGGSVDKDLPYLIYVSNTNNPNPNKQLVAKVRSKGDAILIQSELSKNVAEAPLEYFLQDK